MITIRELKDKIEVLKDNVNVLNKAIKTAENTLGKIQDENKKVDDLTGDTQHELCDLTLDLINKTLSNLDHCIIDYNRDKDDDLEGPNYLGIDRFIDGYVPDDHDAEYYCHYEYENWETGNMEGDTSDNFDTLREAYEEAESCYKNLKHCDNMVILEAGNDVVVMHVDKESGHWFKGGVDW